MKVARVGEDGRILEVLDREDGAPLAKGELEISAGPIAERPQHFRWSADLGAFVERPFKAARLGAGDVLEAIDELASALELTERHIDLRAHGGDCDLPPGLYRWDNERQTFVPLKQAARPGPSGVSLEDALAQLLELNPQLKQGDKTMLWLAGHRSSHDRRKGGKR